MKILVACEESQAVAIEFRKLGHEAYSCDIEPCSGGHPEWHLQQDVIPLLKEKWDMIIAFPPCTYLASAGTRHYSLRMNSAEKVEARIRERDKAVEFFMLFTNADCDKIAIENPVGFINTHWRKPDQIIHPYYFGDNAKKRTCLWLKGLPKLEPTNMLPEPEPMYVCEGEKCKGKKIGWCEGMRNIKGGQKERAKARSKTFPGIAKAMAEQWGGIEEGVKKMIKIMKSYRFRKETLKVIEESVKKINKNIGCDAYDNTKFLESLVYLYSDLFVKEIQTRNKA